MTAIDEQRPAPPILEVVNLAKHYPVRRGKGLRSQKMTLKAVDGVSFSLRPGETFAVVGESGCGKSTLARMVADLITPTSGSVRYEGKDLSRLSTDERRLLRRDIQIIFQDPYSSLDPRMTVGGIIKQAWRAHPGFLERRLWRARSKELIERVGLNPDHIDRFPHQFSGGQRQRIGIARALALEPRVIICDEPVSALDMSVQAQILNLLSDIQHDMNVSYLFIAHDLSVVEYLSDRVAVMYLGRFVETGGVREVFGNALHPYTQGLIAAAPRPDSDPTETAFRVRGEIPSPLDQPSGCHFRPRCYKAQAKCAEEYPALIDRFDDGHPSACFFAEPIGAGLQRATSTRAKSPVEPSSTREGL